MGSFLLAMVVGQVLVTTDIHGPDNDLVAVHAFQNLL
jgi:hypothetical protein